MFSNLKKVQKENEKAKIKVGIDFQKFQELISEETELNLIKKAFTGTVDLTHEIAPELVSLESWGARELLWIRLSTN